MCIRDRVEPDQLGWVRKGMTLASQNGNAEADISDLSLVTDEKGALTFSLHIPDPKVQSNPKFTTGTNTIRLTTSPTNETNLDPGECSAEATYKAGDAYSIQPGHDGWVVGNEPAVVYEFNGMWGE